MHYLHEYKTFDNIHELNHHVKQHTNKRYYDMNETQRQVLQLLSQYSVKHIGASHLKIDTIADGLGKSYRTIIRAIKSLVELHIIENLSTTRRISGGQGANIYRILPYVTPEVAEREAVAEHTPVKDTTPIVEKETANILSRKAISNNTYPLNRTTSYSRPYSRFRDTVTTFMGNDSKGVSRLIHRLYGVFLAQTKALRKAYHVDDLIDVAIESIGATMHASKRVSIGNLAGYFNGVLSNKLDDMHSELMAEVWAMSDTA